MSSEGKSEMYSYKAPWPIYGLGWSHKKAKPFRLAIGSFIEEYTNKVQIVELNEEKGEIVATATIDHPYPTTKIMWIPDLSNSRPDLLATTGDYLRIWRMADDGKSASMECLLNNNKTSEFCAPLTSFDWNETNPSIIGTSSIDTTCTIWNLDVEKAVGKVSGSVGTQLIAHDQEVYDISFKTDDPNRFASVGADGSVRMFDLKNLEHSTIMYEEPQNTALLRLAWNKQDPNYLATLKMDDSQVIILDIRMPCSPAAHLNSHDASVNGLSWAPHSSCHICTAADDKKALIWDLQQIPKNMADPILAYEAGGAINQCSWSAAAPEWISICYEKEGEGGRTDGILEILRV